MTGLQKLVEERLTEGAVPTSEVMALALYHPEHGYYRRNEGPWGFDGKDYYTALDTGPLLGETLALRLQTAWDRLGRPDEFLVLEPGAGRGWLGRDLLSAISGDFARAMVYIHRDDNPAARATAEIALAPFMKEGRARFASEAEPLPIFTGAVISNELFDALPAQPWRWSGEGWLREELTSKGPEWIPKDAGNAGAWFGSLAEDGLHPGDGGVWTETMAPLVQELARSLAVGLFLTIDYGDEGARLACKGPRLRRFKDHRVDDTWWEDLGHCDLTADVDFTRLAQLLAAEGFREADCRSLSHWIRAHAPLREWESRWLDMPAKERTSRMENLLQLTLPGLMGERFKVLEAWKSPPS